ncbi:KUP/HAK/KT family potassium transporter [Brachybacterium sp. NBEC-018]|uniref:potassium transporter Kup n=1 Tax=Brachybacterium sp. NBEC-018 TaxID=2996004 RepID=UPI002174F817|nr:KUP/HAK/KT family potassium transporter [Brachybacterium sp. NBEC-018]UVY85059.1 KUP/HAK/KT family potassium transporter [Brachybacterium sp. NBEC-018]
MSKHAQGASPVGEPAPTPSDPSSERPAPAAPAGAGAPSAPVGDPAGAPHSTPVGPAAGAGAPVSATAPAVTAEIPGMAGTRLSHLQPRSAPGHAHDEHTHRGLGPSGTPRGHKPLPLLMLGALGVVFGDIGTSPLYSLQTVFSTHHNAVAPTEGDVLGVISMVLWCLIVIVTVSYIGLIMRADNQGEGGILSLTALILRKLDSGHRREIAVALVLGVIGASLFYGDSVITPAISVLSAFEGIEVTGSVPNEVIIPGAVIVLTVLFAVQRWGTGRIGGAFGPIMVLWFLTLAAMGLPQILGNPAILRAVSPHYALAFMIDRPLVAFIAMGAVVLTITGAEALYADMGHFGRRPIFLAWTCLVLPALAINYFGQGALILADPTAVVNPFFSLVPDALRLPLVVLAAAATVIASQAVISGAFSVSRQATRLSLLPRLKVTQTDKQHGGQIYIGRINTLLFLGVLALVLIFQHSSALAAAYGLAVTATIILVLALFLLLALRIWHWPLWRVVLMAVIVGGLELVLLAANIVKVPAGGWLPLLIAAVLTTIMLTWKKGSKLLFGRRRAMEGPIDEFVSGPAREAARVPGLAVYPHGDPTTVPLALRTNVAMNHVIHEHVVIVTMKHRGVPHVHRDDRVFVDALGDESDGIVHVSYQVGFHDSQDVPAALRTAVEQLGRPHAPDEVDCSTCTAHAPELAVDPEQAIYFLSVFRIEPGADDSLPRWQKGLFRMLERASANRTQVLHLPPSRTVVMGAETEL